MHELPRNVIRLLNSGQIITSVSSVVKELIENSLDAHSTRIDIKLENSGFDKIEVKDNGIGIKQSEIHLAAQPHYTSKLSNEDDLKTLTTYGFRGEALGAICGVSDVVVISKTKSDDVSISHKFNNLGKIISSKPSPHAQGTTVIVQNLFKNIPVRRQFGSNAKKKKEEIKKVEDLVIAFGTIHPNVRFSVYHNHSQIWQKIAVNDIRSALLLTLGTNMANVLEHKTAKDEKNQIKIDAFLPKLGLSIQQTSRLSLERSVVAVNSRPVRIKDIDKLLNIYYSNGYNMDNRWSRYPICYVAIDLPSSMIDYNIEPDKSSLLFLSLDSVLELLKSILQSLYGDIHNNDQSNSTKYVGKTKETNFENYKCDMISDIDNETIERAEISPEKNKIDDSNEGLLNNHLQLNERNNNNNNISDETASDAIIINEENYQNPSSRKDCLIQSSGNNNDIPKCKENSSDVNIEDFVTSWLNDDDDFDEITKEIELEFPSEDADDNEILQLSNNNDNSNCKNITNKDDNACKKTMENTEQAEKNERINWSLGNIRNEQGNFIEPVKLFIPSTKKRSLEDSSKNSTKSKSPVKKQKSIKNTLDQLSVSDMFISQSNEKFVTPYILFCRDKKHEVISFNPNANSQKIDMLLMRKWTTLPLEKKKEYKLKSEQINKQNNVKKIQKNEENNKESEKQQDKKNSTNKTHEVQNAKLSKPEPQKLLKKDYNKKFKQKEIVISMNVKDLREKIFSKIVLDEDLDNSKFHLIGQISNSGMWIVSYEGHILAVNHFRVQETVEYYRLLATHYFILSELDCPIMLSQSSFGELEIWNALFKLNSEKNEEIGYSLITDDKIIANGFEIKIYTDTAEIIRITKSLPFYGITDLKEILQIIHKQGSSIKLENCRPQKVIHYLQGEAVRNSRIAPAKLHSKDIKKLLQQLECLPSQQKSCLHKKPFFHLLYDLSDISLSQSQSQR